MCFSWPCSHGYFCAKIGDWRLHLCQKIYGASFQWVGSQSIAPDLHGVWIASLTHFFQQLAFCYMNIVVKFSSTVFLLNDTTKHDIWLLLKNWSVLYVVVQALHIMTATKQSKSIDKFRDSCSVEVQRISADRVGVICGHCKRVHSLRIKRVLFVYFFCTRSGRGFNSLVMLIEEQLRSHNN